MTAPTSLTFQDLEEAVLVSTRTAFSPIIASQQAVQMGDIDRLVEHFIQNNTSLGVILEFSGGNREPRAQYSGKRWVWSWTGAVLILYEGDPVAIEVKLSEALNILRTMMVTDPRMGGAVFNGQVTLVGTPDKVSVGDMAAYWVPFQIEVIDKI